MAKKRKDSDEPIEMSGKFINLNDLVSRMMEGNTQHGECPLDHFDVIAYDKKYHKLRLVAHGHDDECEDRIEELPKRVKVFKVNLKPANPERLQGLLVLWVVDELGFVGAECAKLVRDFAERCANNSIEVEKDWKPQWR